MKNIILATTLLFCSYTTVCQDKEHNDVLVADSTWSKEIIKFPLGFAPGIKYQGYEDLRFAEGWKRKNSPDFWTYAFVWNIDLKRELTQKELESDLELYFDGLMNAVNKDKDLEVPKTMALFIKERSSEDISKFIGKVRVYDAFHTKEIIILHILVESHYCKNTKAFMPLFKLSPKPFENDVWHKLNQVKLNSNTCKY